MTRKVLPLVIALVLGILAWLLIEPSGPNQEHWDYPIYWSLAFPAICIGCFILGFIFPKNAWVYGILAMGIQAFPKIFTNLDAELIGVSIFLLTILSIPPVLAGSSVLGYVAAIIRG